MTLNNFLESCYVQTKVLVYRQEDSTLVYDAITLGKSLKDFPLTEFCLVPCYCKNQARVYLKDSYAEAKVTSFANIDDGVVVFIEDEVDDI